MDTETQATESFLFKYRTMLFILLLGLITFGVYSRVITYDFINLDDGTYVKSNPTVQKGLSAESLKYAFNITAKNKAYWHPLTWLSHMLDCQLFGLNPGRHHLINLIFHISNSLLLFYVFYLMTGRFIQCALIAIFFALHPLGVDSVAWIAERKNVLSTFFWILTMLAYVAYSKKPGVIRYFIVVALFILGLMSKPMLVTLPCALLLLDFWPLERVRVLAADQVNNRFPQTTILSIVLEKMPLLVFSFVTIFLSSISLKVQGALWTTAHISMLRRVENALVAYVKYIYKTIWPSDLAIFYPFPVSISLWKVTGAACLLFAISVIVIRQLKSRPWFAVGWFWFLGTLVPVIGLVQGGLFPEMADRWAYVPQIGLFIMIA